MKVKNRNDGSSEELATIIGREGRFEGKIILKHSVRIDGRLKGQLETTETVTIGIDGEVEGDIKAKDVVVGGKVSGSVLANGKVTLESASKLSGDIKTKRLVIEEGALFNGAMEMSDGSPKVPPRKLPAEENKKP